MRKAYKKLTYADRQEIEQMSERGIMWNRSRAAAM